MSNQGKDEFTWNVPVLLIVTFLAITGIGLLFAYEAFPEPMYTVYLPVVLICISHPLFALICRYLPLKGKASGYEGKFGTAMLCLSAAEILISLLLFVLVVAKVWKPNNSRAALFVAGAISGLPSFLIEVIWRTSGVLADATSSKKKKTLALLLGLLLLSLAACGLMLGGEILKPLGYLLLIVPLAIVVLCGKGSE